MFIDNFSIQYNVLLFGLYVAEHLLPFIRISFVKNKEERTLVVVTILWFHISLGRVSRMRGWNNFFLLPFYSLPI